MQANKELQRHVLDELQFEPSVDAAGIGVTVHDGIVTLAGTVKSYAERTAAVRAVERVWGVKAVVDNMQVELVSLHQRNDEDIARAVVNAFEWDVFVPQDRIKVTVENGWVTLEGKVDNRYQKTAAERVVNNLAGIKGVVNTIEVMPAAKPAEVKSKIEDALRRAAEVDAEQIEVDVVNGEVTLRGEVHSWAERNEAERAAWSAPGVHQVRDELSVAA